MKGTPPQGDLDGPVAVRVERGPEVRATRRDEPRLSLVLPLESCVVDAEIGALRTRLDRANMALVPARLPYRLEPISPIPRVLTLLFGGDALDAAAREYAGLIDAAVFTSLVAEPRVLPRTRWVDELGHRYLFERAVCEKHTSAAARFLEIELAKELYYLSLEARDRPRPSALHQGSDLAKRAVAYLEDHLFEPLRMRELARHCRASESTVLRAFRREMKLTPSAFVQGRRLDESLLLLQTGRYSVGEVAGRVGYANVAAFTTAFGRRFGNTPSSVRDADGAAKPRVRRGGSGR